MSRNSAHSAEIPASVMSPLMSTRSSGSASCRRASRSIALDQPPVAARPGAPALDAKAVALADDMNVGKMRDAPDAVAQGRRRRTPRDRAAGRRSRPRSPRRAPRRRDRQDMTTIVLAIVGRTRRCGEARSATVPIQCVCRPRGERDQRRDGEQDKPGGGAAHRAHTGELRSGPALERPLRQVPQRLAPEAHSRAGPRAHSTTRNWSQRSGRADANRPMPPLKAARTTSIAAPTAVASMKTIGSLADPCGQRERRETEQNGGQQDRKRPGEQELRQADFGQEAAGDRQKRPLLRGGMVVLHVPKTRIEERLCA